mgnify:CR=1 FL=1
MAHTTEHGSTSLALSKVHFLWFCPPVYWMLRTQPQERSWCWWYFFGVCYVPWFSRCGAERWPNAQDVLVYVLRHKIILVSRRITDREIYLYMYISTSTGHWNQRIRKIMTSNMWFQIIYTKKLVLGESWVDTILWSCWTYCIVVQLLGLLKFCCWFKSSFYLSCFLWLTSSWDWFVRCKSP